MAASVLAPLNHVEDANGNPYVGAKQFVYNAGTTTLRAVFTDADLTIPAANPQVSDAAGNFPRVFTGVGTYKIRQETSAEVLINEWDDIDTGLTGTTVALPVSLGGTGATTAAAARANLDVPSNSDLTAISTQIAAFQASLANVAAFPQGRLTLSSGTPVLATGVSGSSIVYYTPYTGQLAPIYDGTQFNLRPFSELQLILNSNHVLNSIYDVYIIDDQTDGIVLVTSPAWSSIVPGSCSRAGTADLSRMQGILVNASQYTMRNGAKTYTVAASQGTYLGSIFIDSTAGQVSCLTAYGQSRKWGVWNAYNRRPVFLKAGDSTSSWTYNTGTYRPSNNNAANGAAFFAGLAEEVCDITFLQTAGIASPSTVAGGVGVGIGYNSTTAASGYNAMTVFSIGANNSNNLALFARFSAQPVLGIATATSLERIQNVTGTFFGTEASCLLTLAWSA